MSFKDAFARVGITSETAELDNLQSRENITSEEVPMMYRSQIRQRCSLQNAGSNEHLTRWVDQWVQPEENNSNPKYQHSQLALGLDRNIYRFSLDLPGRLSINSGQDSIIRPAIDAEGIPIIPGSGIKGLFKRWLSKNCLTLEEIKIANKIRFHRVYPIGDWAGSIFHKKTNSYLMVDVLHPQQERQLGIGDKNPHAYAAISLYKPTLLFELSCSQKITLEQWEKVEQWVRSALVVGIGGKTSTGYGLSGKPPYSIERYNLSIPLLGTGVSSLLRTDIPEFRPNQFKASIRGHITRLLGGICSDYKAINSQINYLFGHDKGTGKLSLYWQKSAFIGSLTQGIEKTPVFMGQGKLLVCLPDTEVDWLISIFRFAYIMAGFGKSWRRVWHKCDLEDWHPGFMPSYKTRAIGCHWDCSNSDFVNINNFENLQKFLSQLYEDTQKIKSKLSSNRLNQSQYMTNWREAWHPDNVTVYALETDVSKAIGLFHDETFKYTPAIGGRDIRIKDNQEKKDGRPTSVSSVWHRMLPIGNDRYLEIVTVFRQGKWDHLREGGMRDLFIQELLDREFKLAWGNETIT